jgi:hypothetical protein
MLSCGSAGVSTRSVSGIVADNASQSAVSGATVSAQGQQTTTASDGSFALTNLLQNPVVLTVNASGYQSLVTSVPAPAASQSIGELFLVPVHTAGTGTVTGTVEIEGAPVAAASLSAGLAQALTNAQGAFTLYNVTPGVQTLTVTSADHSDTSTATVTVLADQTVSAGIIQLTGGPPPPPPL